MTRLLVRAQCGNGHEHGQKDTTKDRGEGGWHRGREVRGRKGRRARRGRERGGRRGRRWSASERQPSGNFGTEDALIEVPHVHVGVAKVVSKVGVGAFLTKVVDQSSFDGNTE
jgi:hypothetical protein